MNSLQEIASELKKPGPILLTSHILPDGDSIGSLIGLGLALRAAGYDATMFSVDPVPDRYRFLPETGLIVTGSLPPVEYKRVIVLDCSDHLRILPIWEKVSDSFLINIDHHHTNHLYGTMNLVDSKASATGEIVYRLLIQMGLQIDHRIATALYVAIATDTGSFKYENTSAETHRVTAKLLDAGVKPHEITPVVFDLRSRAATFILREALNSLHFSADGRVAWITLTEENMKKSGASDEHLEGIVNFAKNIEGVEIGLLFFAKPDGTVKVGFRSNFVDVGKVAETLGGGGHARAAGCSLKTDLDSALSTVFAAINQLL